MASRRQSTPRAGADAPSPEDSDSPPIRSDRASPKDSGEQTPPAQPSRPAADDENRVAGIAQRAAQGELRGMFNSQEFQQTLASAVSQAVTASVAPMFQRNRLEGMSEDALASTLVQHYREGRLGELEGQPASQPAAPSANGQQSELRPVLQARGYSESQINELMSHQDVGALLDTMERISQDRVTSQSEATTEAQTQEARTTEQSPRRVDAQEANQAAIYPETPDELRSASFDHIWEENAEAITDALLPRAERRS